MRKKITLWALILALLLTLTTPAAAASAGAMEDLAGLTPAHAQGLDGSGIVIAVIDTGIDLTHPAFSDEGMDPAKVKLTRSDISAKLSALNARRGRVSAGDVYHSAKIPFAFDYTDYSADVSQGDSHGTSVAAAAAGVETAECGAGAAPGAQLLVMKVFGDGSDSASDSAILAAVEDAVALGADVINLSLGTTTGLSYGLTSYSKALENAAKAGIVICAASGNDVSSANGNNSGLDLGTTANVDTGIISEPANLGGVLSVASVGQTTYYASGFMAKLDGGKNTVVSVTDTGSLYGLRDFTDLLELAGHKDGVFEYAVVPGIGTEEDYDQVDVKGRIALVKRGEINFTVKSDNAFARGAVGVIVYNNVFESITMDMTDVSEGNDLPCVIISKEDGEALVSAAGSGGVGSLTVLNGTRLVESADGGQPSSFSSIGPLSDLTLKPDVSAVGGNVYTAVNGDTYGTVSGTSMAAPQTAGTMALLLQYLKETYSLTGPAARLRAQTLLMNTAQPVLQENGVEYTPRKQGAGLISAADAVDTPAYVTVNGSEFPKAELGDDRDGKGVWSFTFTVCNDSEQEQSYILRASAAVPVAEDGYMLEEVRQAGYTAEWSGGGVSALYERDDDGQVIYRDVNGDGILTLMDIFLLKRAVLRAENGISGDRTVTVPAGGSEEVTVTVRLTEQEKQRLTSEYENGVYVEGYVYLEALDALSPELSIPMLAFFGDWSKAPLFETTALADLESAAAEGEAVGNSPDAFAVLTGWDCYLGEDPVAQDDEYIPERSNALGVSGEYGTYISGAVLDLLRSARSVKVQIVSQGRVLYETEQQDLVKSHMSSGETGMGSEFMSFRFDPARYGLGDGSSFTIRFTGVKDAEGPNAVETMEIPVYVDGAEPVFQQVTVERQDGRTVLKVTVRDNFYTAGLAVFTADGSTELGCWAVNQKVKGETVTMELDLTDILPEDAAGLILGAIDYGRNRTFYDITLD